MGVPVIGIEISSNPSKKVLDIQGVPAIAIQAIVVPLYYSCKVTVFMLVVLHTCMIISYKKSLVIIMPTYNEENEKENVQNC